MYKDKSRTGAELFYLAKVVLKEKGILALFQSFSKVFKNELYYYYFKAFKQSKAFKLQGNDYYYLFHSYNTTWKNERIVELPIIWREIENNNGKRILEVGNVLSHYFKCDHDIVDKYEKAPRVINEDIVDFKNKKYDLIVSISTIEHIGYDEKPRDPGKITKALNNIKKLLNKNGKFVATFPIGYNKYLDEKLIKNKLPFSRVLFMKRISKENEWIETNYENIKDVKFGSPFGYANAIVIAYIDSK